MKRAFSTLCCLNYTAEEILDLAKESRMEGVELRLDMPKVYAWLEDPSVIGFVKSWPQTGVVVSDIAASVSINSYDEQTIHNGRSCIDLAHKIGAKGVRVFAGAHRARFSDRAENDFDGIVASLKELCLYAADKNVEIWLETHSDLSSGGSVRPVIDAVDMPNMKVVWDIIHSIEYKETLQETLAYLEDRVAHVHWKDGRFSGDPDQCQYIHTDLGAGEMPLAELLALLEERRYDGFVSLEWESPWRPEIRDLYPDPKDLLKKYNQLLDAAGGEIR